MKNKGQNRVKIKFLVMGLICWGLGLIWNIAPVAGEDATLEYFLQKGIGGGGAFRDVLVSRDSSGQEIDLLGNDMGGLFRRVDEDKWIPIGKGIVGEGYSGFFLTTGLVAAKNSSGTYFSGSRPAYKTNDYGQSWQRISAKLLQPFRGKN